LQTVLDTFPLSIFWKDRNSVYLGCNYHFLKDTGLISVADIIGKTDYDMPWGNTEADAYRADDKEVMNSKTPKLGIIETQLQGNGEIIWLETNKLPLYDLEGNVLGVLGTYQNITKRKQTENALQESKQFLQTVLDTFPLAVFWKDRNSVVLGCNQLFAQLSGFTSPLEVVGKGTFDLGYTEAEALGCVADDRRVMDSNTSELNIQETITISTGKQIWVETNKIPLQDLDGNVVGVVGTFQDITNRKRSEIALRESEAFNRKLVENFPVGLVSCRMDGQLIYVNSAFANILGRTVEETLSLKY
jgi:PAS domain S-box-containing protein